MKKKHFWIYFTISAIILISLSTMISNAKNKDIQTIPNVDLEKYAGKWYEIARFNHSFEKGLVGVTATYTIQDRGKIEVINAGYKDSLSGEFTSRKARAKVPDPETPGKLKVYFFLFFGAAYNILELDTENYQYALVGSSSDKFLWILSRTPQMKKADLDYLIDAAQKRGYDTSKLIMVDQPLN